MPPRSDDESVPVDVQEALATLLSANDASVASNSCGIMKKLLVNATTKGQTPNEDAAKFRKVRLANAKIKAALVDVEGAMDLMLLAGFALEEQEGESVLVFPADYAGPDWLPNALSQLDVAAGAK